MPVMCTRQPATRSTPQTLRAERDTDARRTVGRLGEDLAAQHLTRLGFSTLARNVRTRHGEIDLIVFDEQRVLAFVEVKTRRAGFGGRAIRPEQEPLPWLRPRQRARLRRLARPGCATSATSGPPRARSASTRSG